MTNYLIINKLDFSWFLDIVLLGTPGVGLSGQRRLGVFNAVRVGFLGGLTAGIDVGRQGLLGEV